MTIARNKRSSGRTFVGTCGFAQSQARLFRDFDILEVQHTFYQPPKVTTAERWRQKAPRGFVFTLKAWQLVTHDASSPTYRRLKEKLSDTELDRCGSLRWNDTTRWAWERTCEIAEALQATAILLQMPRSFGPTRENLRRLYRFCEVIDRGGRHIVFEPRGEGWDDDLLRRLASELDLIHAVDPFLRQPVNGPLRYFRLHGRPAYHYNYRYTPEDLTALQSQLNRQATNYVLFNNTSMADDARRFRELLRLGADVS